MSEQVASKEPWPPAGVSRVGKGIMSPEFLTEAKRIVLADGTVGEVRVVPTDRIL
ncbi:MAG: hypothetical protein ABIS06_03475 [Vicinamibacterales bacterium]